jgi:dUTP pyrophosphatase
MQVRFKRLHPGATEPQRMTEGAAGFDLTSVSSTYDLETNNFVYSTGLAVEIPPGFVGLLFPRSSVYKKGLLLCNSVGVIDSDYRGDISFRFTNAGPGSPYFAGERIGQLVIMPNPKVEFVETEELNDTKRGAGGYGSTGS